MIKQTVFPDPVVVRHPVEPHGRSAALVVLLHGRGSDETDIVGLAGGLPQQAEYVAVRAPIPEGGGYAWFANRGIGRPQAQSLRGTMDWFTGWLDGYAADRPVYLVGFSGGAAFAGGLVLDRPDRYAGAAILYGTLPFDAGLEVQEGRLRGLQVFVGQGLADTVIPAQLLERTWTYLNGPAGAQVRAMRVPGGHGISAAVRGGLADWLADCLAVG